MPRTFVVSLIDMASGSMVRVPRLLACKPREAKLDTSFSPSPIDSFVACSRSTRLRFAILSSFRFDYATSRAKLRAIKAAATFIVALGRQKTFAWVKAP